MLQVSFSNVSFNFSYALFEISDLLTITVLSGILNTADRTFQLRGTVLIQRFTVAFLRPSAVYFEVSPVELCFMHSRVTRAALLTVASVTFNNYRLPVRCIHPVLYMYMYIRTCMNVHAHRYTYTRILSRTFNVPLYNQQKYIHIYRLGLHKITFG